VQHSVKYIGKSSEDLSEKRGDEKRFNAEDFFNFAKGRMNRYSLIENGDDLLVSTWFSGDLIDDYKNQIK